MFYFSDNDQIIGCSTPTHPTKRFIQGHKHAYMNYGDKEPLKSIVHGGGNCHDDNECGRFGKCESKRGSSSKKECVCQTHEFTGPHCLVSSLHSFMNSFLCW